MQTSSYLFSFSAGLLSVMSPCILPILPIIVTGKAQDSKFRPLLIVLGLASTFVLMGILSTLFGQIISPYIYSIEKISGVVILFFGIMLLLDINILKNIGIFGRINYQGEGALSGLFLGMTLGLIWIPCVGPVLSSILAMVASAQDMYIGITSLLVYSLGFAIPLLIAAYAAHFFRSKVVLVKQSPALVRYISAIILILFGLYIIFFGLINFTL